MSPSIAQPAVRYRTSVAASRGDIEEAQRLRFEVHALDSGAGRSAAGLDVDEWDEHCEHLVVREEVSDRIVATCRLLPPGRAAALGRCQGDTEFDLARHAALRPHLVEAGRSCVHPDHRTGPVVTQLCAGVARYVVRGGYAYLGACASVPLADGGATAAGVWDLLISEEKLAPAGLWVFPRVPFDVDGPVRPVQPVLPPLLLAYLRIGARVCGRPAHDVHLGTADFYLLLGTADVDPRVLPGAAR